MKKIINSKIFVFLIASIIPLLISGPFFPDLLVSLSSLFFLFFLFFEKNNFLNKKIFWIFCLFCTSCIVSSLLSSDIIYSTKKSFFYFRIGIFIMLIWYMLTQSGLLVKYCYNILFVTFFCLIIDGYFQYFYSYNLINIPTGMSGTRLSSFFGSELILGSYLVRFLPLFFGLYFLKKNKNLFEIYFFSFFSFLIFILIFLSGERTAFFLSILFYLYFLILNLFLKKIHISKFFLIILVFFSTILFIAYSNKTIKQRMFDDVIYTFGDKKNLDQNTKNKFYFFSINHDSHFRTAYQIFIDKPVFGHGVRMFRKTCQLKKFQVGQNPCNTHPHNIYLELLAETGFIGFLFVFSVFLYVLKQIYKIFFCKNKICEIYQLAFLGSILINFWPITTTGSFFNNWMMIVYAYPIGFYLFYLKKKDNSLLK